MPKASPSLENCRYCDVKQLCANYWSTVPPAATDALDEWFDFEGTVLRANGTRSWWLRGSRDSRDEEVLVRTVETNVPFPTGGSVRLLGVRRSHDPDDPDRLVMSTSPTTEWFAVST